MITPHNITNYNRTQSELEEFLLFAILVAGKTAKTQAKKLDLFLTDHPVKNGTLNDKKDSPFEFIERLINLNMLKLWMMDCKLGQYNRLDKAIRGILQFKGKLDSVSLEELESVEGIGPKTSRFFLLHSRINQQLAVLDTHILKYMNENGYVVPKVTPSDKKKYRKIEEDFLYEAKILRKNPADLDLEIWKSYSK
jgi:thermostable 8-oxoguanine DNA glycosylase